MAVDRKEHRDEHRQDRDDHPRAHLELTDADDHGDDARCDRAGAVDHRADLPAPAPVA